MKPLLLPVVAGSVLLVWTAGNAVSLQAAEGEVRVPHSFESGTPAVAAEVNANFDTLETGVNANRTEVAALGARTDTLELADAARDVQVTTLFESIEASDGDVSALQAEVEALEGQLANVEADLAAAQEQLAAQPRSERLIVVAPEGGDFDSIGAALDSIDAVAPRTLVRVLPGTYDEAPGLVVPSNVHLIGDAHDTTILRTSAATDVPTGGADASALVLSDGARVSHLGVLNEGVGPGLYSTAIYAENLSGPETLLEDVRALGNVNGGTTHRGVHLINSALTMRDCIIEGDGIAAESTALEVANGVSNPGPVRVIDCFLEARGSAVLALGATLEVDSSQLLATQQCVFGIQTEVNARQSSLRTTGNVSVVFLTDGSQARIAASQLSGGEPVTSSSEIKFVGCWKSNYDPIADGVGSSIAP